MSGDLAACIAETAAFIEQCLAADEATAELAGPARVAWLTLRNDDGSMRYTTVAAGVNGEFDEPWCADGHEIENPASVRVVYDPARSRRRVRATRELVAEILAERHEYVPGDEYYSCSQAAAGVYLLNPPPEDLVPGSGCADDDRAGKPCDCGRDQRVARRLDIIASEWREAA